MFKMLSEVGLRKTEQSITPNAKPPTVDAMNWKLIREATSQAGEKAIVVTWLGHACALVQINGVNVLLDPVFSDRCSPFSFVGPKRYTEPPCQLKDLPKIDAVVISHNHYDHLDLNSIKELAEQHPEAHFYVPLGNKAWFNIEKSNERVTELDWWQDRTLTLGNGKAVKLTCTPCQHFSGRGILDRNKTLWASWCLEGVREGQSSGGKVFFGGDTGYRAVPQGTKPDAQYDEDHLDTLPHCPAFKEIGSRIGPFDLSLIPIGAYSPRWFMSTIHCSPEDAVRVHEDVKSKKSIGIHWGTFVLTDEPIDEPPERLKKALQKRGHDGEVFGVLKLGETMVIETSSSSTTSNL
ncbi:beta-lactamase superfamily domain-containing protein [Zychaea mexicana]|uniref:beta-lactamase superfamily domain-containing protein n=1 Tax=Zychaea mexicana TaxID=64656 RepID=UPI0022FEB541|nr:beta-lactamase superfamily domain-containing protein [Zychaea mexicana]KAI9498659.1 beta-lactamase superfamily domain-containing protein [Zychaea mexicana]